MHKFGITSHDFVYGECKLQFASRGELSIYFRVMSYTHKTETHGSHIVGDLS